MTKHLTKDKKYAVKKSSAGLGLFATEDFAKGEFVIEYTGKKLTQKQANEKGGKYLFEIDDDLTLDGTARHHIGRYLNHSCKPNCEAVVEEYLDDEKSVMIYTRRAVKAGEELTYNYGKEYVDAYIKPHGCRCAPCTK